MRDQLADKSLDRLYDTRFPACGSSCRGGLREKSASGLAEQPRFDLDPPLRYR